jgi:uncharacterized protein YlbG (UPF0298 family)
MEQYLNFDFDKILLDNNNELIGSEEIYLKHKRNYFQKAQDNFLLYKKLNAELSKLTDSQYTVKDNKYIYIYVDQRRVDKLNSEAKRILSEQMTAFENFKNYLYSLNDDKNKYNYQQTKKKSFLSRFMSPSTNNTNNKNGIGTSKVGTSKVIKRRSFDSTLKSLKE